MWHEEDVEKQKERHPIPQLPPAIGLFVGALLIAAIVGMMQAGSADGDGFYEDPFSHHLAQAGKPAPELAMTAIDGRTVDLAALKGTPVVVAFWATWCPNCQRDIPYLNEMYEQRGRDFEVIAVDLDEPESLVRDFVEREGIAFPVAIDDGGVAGRFGIVSTNTHFLIDRNGIVHDIIVGDVFDQEIADLVAVQ